MAIIQAASRPLLGIKAPTAISMKNTSSKMKMMKKTTFSKISINLGEDGGNQKQNHRLKPLADKRRFDPLKQNSAQYLPLQVHPMVPQDPRRPSVTK